MAADAFFLSLLKNELNSRISGSRIEKVRQPAKDVILLSLKGRGGKCTLLISACPGRARMHLTEEEYENPSEPPMFCMLLRKHITGAVIKEVTQPGEDRVLELGLSCSDELGRASEFRIIAELMNKTPNIVLVGGDGLITDCIRRLDYDRDMYRRLFPGMIYRCPQKSAGFSPVSPLVKREMEFRLGGPDAALPLGEFAPYMVLKDGDPFEFSFLPVYQYGSACKLEKFESYSHLLDSFYSLKEKNEIIRRKSKELRTSVSNAVKKTEKKLAAQRSELERTASREQIKKSADLITANIYRIPKGAKVLRCEDYFEDGMLEIEVDLDPLKSPQANAAALYKEYNRQKTAEQYLRRLISEGEGRCEYFRSVLDELERVSCEAEIAAIRDELELSGVLKKRRASPGKRKGKPLPYLSFKTSDGFEILVGRNNAQNDELTFKTAFKSDYWFHVKNFHGSHVILRCAGEEPSLQCIAEAARYALEYSQARESGAAAVDYTKVRNVKKPAGALPGKVIYTDYRTVTARM